MLRSVSSPVCRSASSQIFKMRRLSPQATLVCIRGYQNYKTSGEMAKLKPPSPSTLFLEKPEWPKVLDMTPEAIQLRKRQNFYKEIQKYPTPNHKQFMINVERGRRQVFYNPEVHDYNALESYQYATRTTHKSEPSTENLLEVSSDVMSLVEGVIVAQNSTFDCRDKMGEVLVPAPVPITSTKHPGSFEGFSFEPGLEVEHKRSRGQHMMIGVLNALRFVSSLPDCCVLEQPRLEAFWEHARYRTNKEGNGRKREGAEHFSPMFQYSGQADLLVSTPVPLCPLVPPDAPEVYSSDFPEFDFYPETHGWREKERHLVSAIGYWPESGHFPLCIADDMAKVFPTTRDPAVCTDYMRSPERRTRLLAAHSLLANFACAAATAYNQGFTLYQEVTYPIVSQCIISDGQSWHFSRLQLNTLAFGPDFDQNKQNLAWSTEEMQLYDTIENGTVKGLNKRVVAKILATLQAARKPVEDASPYVDLGVEKKFLERGRLCWRHMAARRFNLGEYLEKEIPYWVKIYKMHPDAPPSPMLAWERQKYLHMFQYNEKIYQMEKKVLDDKRKDRNRKRLLEGKFLKND
ncbi:hypothetical protein BIW11_06370 [Tropilaelaps mercedesae]|uniref:39S ribosomal protein L37 n=1 Tax=Tropilaelaps mercedesae TaxID=418985 RepID=A0A1V9XYF4_9ACAR|nr:hypothetical protein BIW11_06370 [Tropilaelaps mercedesae]